MEYDDKKSYFFVFEQFFLILLKYHEIVLATKNRSHYISKLKLPNFSTVAVKKTSKPVLVLYTNVINRALTYQF